MTKKCIGIMKCINFSAYIEIIDSYSHLKRIIKYKSILTIDCKLINSQYI